MWLSGANAVAGKARSVGTAEMRRQQNQRGQAGGPLLEWRMAG